MKANELRIENYILNDGVVVQADGRTIFDIWSGTSKNYQPIPITEEWLIKFGFESNPYQDRYELGDLYFECNKTRGVTELYINGFGHIKHVHQLQNLYFIGYGTELIIKETT